MVDKTKRALAILQHRSLEATTTASTLWPPHPPTLRRHFPHNLEAHNSQNDYHELKKPRSEHMLPSNHFPKSTMVQETDRLTAVINDAVRRQHRPPGNTHMGNF